jgi:hypothetical protein
MSVRNREGKKYGLVRGAFGLDSKLKSEIHRQGRRNSDTFMDDSK